jgi:hypothetical protein
VALSLVAMAGLTLERLARLVESSRGRGAAADRAGAELRPLPWIIGAVLAVAVMGMMATSGAAAGPTGAPTAAQGWGRFALFTAAIGGIVWLWVRDRAPTAVAATLIVLVTVADLWLIGRRFVHTVDPPDAIFAADDVVNFLRNQPQPSRIWTFPYPRMYRGNGAYGGDYPMRFGIDQVGGEHPNMLQSWNEYVGAGTETYIDWHNLITGAEIVGTPEGGQALRFSSEEGFLDAANVRYIVSMAPLVHPDLREVHRGSALVYENTAALPRAYLVPSVREVPTGASVVRAMADGDWDPARVAYAPAGVVPPLPRGPLDGTATVTLYEPDRVTVRTRADRAALLVLADNFYEGWQAEIGGEPAEVLRVNHTMRGVVVPAGEHVVTFTFEPDDLRVGLYLTAAGFLLLAGFGLLLLARRRRGARDHTGSAGAG